MSLSHFIGRSRASPGSLRQRMGGAPGMVKPEVRQDSLVLCTWTLRPQRGNRPRKLAGGPAGRKLGSCPHHSPQRPSLPGPLHLATAFTSKARCQPGKEPHLLFLRSCQGSVCELVQGQLGSLAIPHISGLGGWSKVSPEVLILQG